MKDSSIRSAVAVCLTGMLVIIGGSAGASTAGAIPPRSAGGLPIGWATVSGGGAHTCAIRSRGGLWCWGSNESGQVGDGTTQQRTSPTKISDAQDWSAVSAGAANSCAVRTDGSLWCWGDNSFEQVGDGTRTTRLAPVQVGEGTTWVSVSVSSVFACAVAADHSAWCWGSDRVGQLGDGRHGTGTQSGVPTLVPGAADWASVTTGYKHTCGVRLDGSGWCWGQGNDGELGDGMKRSDLSDVPRRVAGHGTWESIDSAHDFSCGIQTDRTAWCWGRNTSGQLGIGGSASKQIVSVPTEVGSDPVWGSVTGGWAHTCAIQRDASAWCWGYNSSGQLGHGDQIDTNIPVPVVGPADWAVLTSGSFYTCGVRTDHTLWCWGSNSDGQLGLGHVSDAEPSPVKVKHL